MAKNYILISRPLGSLLESFKVQCQELLSKPEDTIIFFGDETRKYSDDEFIEALKDWAIARKEQIDKLSGRVVNLFFLGKKYHEDHEEIVLERMSSWKLGATAHKLHVIDEESDSSPVCGYFCISPDIAERLALPVSDERITTTTTIARFRGDSDPVGVSDFAPPVNLAGLFTMADDPVSY